MKTSLLVGDTLSFGEGCVPTVDPVTLARFSVGTFTESESVRQMFIMDKILEAKDMNSALSIFYLFIIYQSVLKT